MLGWIVAGLIIALVCGTLGLDLVHGATYVSMANGNGGRWVRRDEMPLVYFCILAVKALVALLLAGLVTGWFQAAIEWTI